MNFNISKSQVQKFANFSEDFNKIHLDSITGYNSLFGEKIVYGVLIILFFFKKLKVKKIQNIKFNFSSHTALKQEIAIKKINKKSYQLYQNKKVCVSADLDNICEKINIKNFKKFFFL